jgi:hypothetical protein
MHSDVVFYGINVAHFIEFVFHPLKQAFWLKS